MAAQHLSRLAVKLNPQQPSGFVIIVPMRIKIVTVSSKGQITIPKDLRTRLGMPPGAKVELWVEQGSLRARPLKALPKQSRRS
jgi:AbrB family looped-hinge helix DNA binding protein